MTERDWPHDKPNGWNLDAAKFLALVQAQPMMWLLLSQAKYIELRIDTRDGGFNLYDRDRKLLNPDDVIHAIQEADKRFGRAPYRGVMAKARVDGEQTPQTDSK